MSAEPGVAIKLAGTCAASWLVVVFSVVGSGLPFQFTVVVLMRFKATTLSWKAALPAVACVGEIEDKVGVALNVVLLQPPTNIAAASSSPAFPFDTEPFNLPVNPPVNQFSPTLRTIVANLSQTRITRERALRF
jgi:hypothetical protein